MHQQWQTHLQFNLIDIIDHGDIQGLRVGSSVMKIQSILGEPQYPVAKLNKKSKVYCHLYGNINIYSANDVVEAINIDVHGNQKLPVILGELVNWRLAKWLSWAESSAWQVEQGNERVNLSINNLTIQLFPSGKLALVSLGLT